MNTLLGPVTTVGAGKTVKVALATAGQPKLETVTVYVPASEVVKEAVVAPVLHT